MINITSAIAMNTGIAVIYRVMWGRLFPKLYCLYTVLKLSKLCLNQIMLGAAIQMYRSDWPWQFCFLTSVRVHPQPAPTLSPAIIFLFLERLAWKHLPSLLGFLSHFLDAHELAPESGSFCSMPLSFLPRPTFPKMLPRCCVTLG